jgi:hypothetical protein
MGLIIDSNHILVSFGFLLPPSPLLLLLPMARQPPVGQGLPIIEASLSRSDTPHSAGFLWTGDQPDALPDNTQHSQETDIRAPGGIRTHNPSKRAVADKRLSPRGHWVRPWWIYTRTYTDCYIYTYISTEGLLPCFTYRPLQDSVFQCTSNSVFIPWV